MKDFKIDPMLKSKHKISFDFFSIRIFSTTLHLYLFLFFSFSGTMVHIANQQINKPEPSSNSNTYAQTTPEAFSLSPLGIAACGQPGNVDNPQLWLKADAGVTSAPNVSYWSDQSSNGKNAEQSSIGNQPAKVDNSINFNPAISFDGMDDYLSISNGIFENQTYNNVNIFAVAKTSSIQDHYLFYESVSPDQLSAQLPGSSNTIHWNAGNISASYRLSTSWTETINQPYIWSFNYSATNTPYGHNRNIGKNGISIASNTNTSSFQGMNEAFNIAADNTGTSSFHGAISEMIIYSDTISLINQQKIQSYLGLKYGIHLSHNYLASDYDGMGSGTQFEPLWDITINDGWNNNITGIGRDDCSSLDQRQSKSNNNSGMVEIYHGNVTTSFPTVNSSNTNAFNSDKSFMLWGNNGSSLNAFSENIYGSNSISRLPRIWKVSETGIIDTVTVRVLKSDLPSTNKYFLFINSSSDNTFPNDFSTKKIELTDNGSYLYAAVIFDNEDIFSFGEDCNGFPGSICGSQLWLKADTGVSGTTAVSAWADQSNHNHNAIQNTAINQPALSTSGINFNPAITLNGIDDFMKITNGIFNSTTYSDMNFYAVAQTNAIQDNYLFYEAVSPEIVSVQLPKIDNTIYWDAGHSTGDHRLSSTWGQALNTPYLWSFNYSTSATPYGHKQNIGLNGSSIKNDATATAFTGTGGSFSLGADTTGINPFSGVLAELIAYPKNISLTAQQKIQSYLGLKYGITLSHNYLASNYDGAGSGTQANPIWNATSNATYHNDVTGIGRDTSTLLDQRQSKSINSTGVIEIYNGNVTTSFPTTNSSNSNAFSTDKSFLIWGNNGAGFSNYNTSIYSSPSYGRVAQLWKVSETGTVGTVSIRLLKSSLPAANKYYLFVNNNDDNTFPNDVTTQRILLTDNGTYLYATVDFTDGNIFSLGTECNGYPGNICGALLWLKADTGVIGTTAVSAWADQSNNNHNAIQNTASNQPTLNAASINFNPSITLDGSNDFMKITNGIFENAASYTDLNIYAIAQTNTIQDNYLFYEAVSPNLISAQLPWSDSTIYWDAGNSIGDYRLSATWGQALSTPYLWSFNYSTSTTPYGHKQNIGLNGSSIGNDTNATAFTGSSGSFSIGADTTGTNPFSGAVAELIVFPKNIDLTAQQRIETYLGLKYGITLSHNYLASNYDGLGSGTQANPIWDATANATYLNDVTGIGRDTSTLLDQRQSKSINGTGIVEIYNGNVTASFPATNAANSNAFSVDKSFLIWGHNNAGLSSYSTSIYSSTSNSRVPQLWKVSETGTVGLVTIRLLKSNLPSTKAYYLFVNDNNDNTFPNDATTQKVILTDDGTYLYATVDFTNGDIFSFGTDCTGYPGNVCDSKLWITADTGVTGTTSVSTWADQSSNNRSIIQGTSPNQPALSSTAINFNPAITFDGSDYFNTSLSINHDSMPDASILAVYRPHIDNAGSVWGEDDGGWDRFLLDHSALNNMVSDGSGGNNNINNLFVANQTNLSAVLYDNTVSNGSSVFVNGTSEVTFTANHTGTSPNLQIGALGGSNYNFDGDIAELIVYNKLLSTIERQRIESYLAIKYGLSISSNYLASDYDGTGSGTQITPIWDATANSAYHNDVTGIGQDIGTSLDQRQSKSANSTDILEIYHGDVTASFPTDNTSNSNAFSTDKNFMLWGHNGGSLSACTNIQSGVIINRFSRIWKVIETGTIGTTTIRILKSSIPNYLTHLYLNNSDNTAFPNDVSTRSISLTDDGTYLYATVDFVSGEIFTLGGTFIHPGNVHDAQLWLKADVGTTGTSTVSAWEDQSCSAISVTQTTASNQGALSSAAINFNPAITLDGSDYFNTSLSINYGTMPDASILTVYRPHIDNAQGVWGEDDGGWDRFLADHSAFNNMVSDGAGGNNNINNLFVANQTNLSTVLYDNTVSNGSSVFVNGTSEATFTANHTSTSPNLQIGALGASNYNFDGDIAELIVYNKLLSTIERQRIESYLAIKYGLSISSNYLASDYDGTGSGTQVAPIWDATANAAYHNDVTGIGLDNTTGLDQRQSKNQSTTGLFEIYNGDVTAAFPTTNTGNNNTFTSDKSFLIWGHNGEDIDNYCTNIYSGTSISRLSRIWKVKETGTIGTSTFRVLKSALPEGASHLYLNNNNDATFPNDVTTRRIAFIDDGTYLYGIVDFADDEIFSIGGAKGSPGNVLGAQLWLKADAGISGNTSISAWRDLSCNNNHTAQATSTNQPTISSAAVNFNPAITFDGSDDYMSISGGLFNTSTHTDVNIYAIAQTNSIQSNYLFYEALSPSNISAQVPHTDNSIYWDAGNSSGDYRQSTAWGGAINTPYLWTFNYSTTTTPYGQKTKYWSQWR